MPIFHWQHRRKNGHALSMFDLDRKWEIHTQHFNGCEFFSNGRYFFSLQDFGEINKVVRVSVLAFCPYQTCVT